MTEVSCPHCGGGRFNAWRDIRGAQQRQCRDCGNNWAIQRKGNEMEQPKKWSVRSLILHPRHVWAWGYKQGELEAKALAAKNPEYAAFRDKSRAYFWAAMIQMWVFGGAVIVLSLLLGLLTE